MKVSVVLPTYNEAGNIVSLVEKILSVMPTGIQPEVIVVDDESPDNTYKIARQKFELVREVRIFRRTDDRGLAKSIRYGIEQATGDYVIVMDTDFTHDPAEIPRMIQVGEIYDIVSGSRFCAGGNMEEKAHYIASFIYNLILRIIIRTQVQDNLGGFFLIKRKNLKLLPFEKIFYGYGDYYFRMIYYAEKKNYSIIEIPTFYANRRKGKSKSNFIKLLFTYSCSAFRLVIKK